MCMEMKIKGKPWYNKGNEAVQARRSLSRIIEIMAANEYMPYCAVSINKKMTDSLLFKRQPYKMKCSVACIALLGYNWISLLDFPPDLVAQMRDCINQCYPGGVTSERELTEGNLQLRLSGQPWVTKNNESYNATAMLGRMMRVAELQGWSVVMSAETSCNREGAKVNNERMTIDAHTLYFTKVLPPS